MAPQPQRQSWGLLSSAVPMLFLLCLPVSWTEWTEGLSGCRREAEGTPETVGDICSFWILRLPSRLQAPAWEASCLVCHMLTFLPWPLEATSCPTSIPLTGGGSLHPHHPFQDEGEKGAWTFSLMPLENSSRLCQEAPVGKPAPGLPLAQKLPLYSEEGGAGTLSLWKWEGDPGTCHLETEAVSPGHYTCPLGEDLPLPSSSESSLHPKPP